MNLLSLSYLLFVPLVWVLSRIMRPGKGRQLLWLAASYFFYATWSLKFLCVLIVSSLVNYALGIYVRRNPSAGPLIRRLCRVWWRRKICQMRLR